MLRSPELIERDTNQIIEVATNQELDWRLNPQYALSALLLEYARAARIKERIISEGVEPDIRLGAQTLSQAISRLRSVNDLPFGYFEDTFTPAQIRGHLNRIATGELHINLPPNVERVEDKKKPGISPEINPFRRLTPAQEMAILHIADSTSVGRPVAKIVRFGVRQRMGQLFDVLDRPKTLIERYRLPQPDNHDPNHYPAWTNPASKAEMVNFRKYNAAQIQGLREQLKFDVTVTNVRVLDLFDQAEKNEQPLSSAIDKGQKLGFVEADIQLPENLPSTTLRIKHGETELKVAQLPTRMDQVNTFADNFYAIILSQIALRKIVEATPSAYRLQIQLRANAENRVLQKMLQKLLVSDPDSRQSLQALHEQALSKQTGSVRGIYAATILSTVLAACEAQGYVAPAPEGTAVTTAEVGPTLPPPSVTQIDQPPSEPPPAQETPALTTETPVPPTQEAHFDEQDVKAVIPGYIPGQAPGTGGTEGGITYTPDTIDMSQLKAQLLVPLTFDGQNLSVVYQGRSAFLPYLEQITSRSTGETLTLSQAASGAGFVGYKSADGNYIEHWLTHVPVPDGAETVVAVVSYNEDDKGTVYAVALDKNGKILATLPIVFSQDEKPTVTTNSDGSVSIQVNGQTLKYNSATAQWEAAEPEAEYTYPECGPDWLIDYLKYTENPQDNMGDSLPTGLESNPEYSNNAFDLVITVGCLIKEQGITYDESTGMGTFWVGYYDINHNLHRYPVKFGGEKINSLLAKTSVGQRMDPKHTLYKFYTASETQAFIEQIFREKQTTQVTLELVLQDNLALFGVGEQNLINSQIELYQALITALKTGENFPDYNQYGTDAFLYVFQIKLPLY